ncbi:MAG: hypothetical protein GY852_07845, partial [bacterium]|nr:hypothetical protein [bacterium]
MGYDEGLLGYESMHRELTPEEEQQLEEYSVLTPQYEIDYKNIPEVFRHALYTNLPMMFSAGMEGMEESLAIGMAAGAGTAAVGALAVPAVGAAPGFGAGFSGGFAVAKTFFTTDAIKRTTAGHTYLKLKGMEGENGEKIPDNIARDVAEISGGLSGLAEVASIAALLTGLPGVKSVVDLAIKHGPTLLGRSMLGQAGVKFMGHLTGAVIS